MDRASVAVISDASENIIHAAIALLVVSIVVVGMRTVAHLITADRENKASCDVLLVYAGLLSFVTMCVCGISKS